MFLDLLVSSPSLPPSYTFLSGPSLPMRFSCWSSCSHLVSIAVLWSLFSPSPNFYTPVATSGLGRIVPERVTNVSQRLSLSLAHAKGVWQIHLLRLHPILGRKYLLQFSNSEHVCFCVCLCIHTLMPASAGLWVTRAALSGKTADTFSWAGLSDGRRGRTWWGGGGGLRAEGSGRWKWMETGRKGQKWVCGGR